jgi:hypothetical protein
VAAERKINNGGGEKAIAIKAERQRERSVGVAGSNRKMAKSAK